MSLRRKLRKLRHMYKERGKGADESGFKKFCQEQGITEDMMDDSGNEKESRAPPSLRRLRRRNSEKNKQSKGENVVRRMEDVDISNLYRFKQFMVTDNKKEVDVIDIIKKEQVDENEIVNVVNNELTGDYSQRNDVNRLSFGEHPDVYRASRRRILPELNSGFHNLPQFKWLSIEHNYFLKGSEAAGKVTREPRSSDGRYSDSGSVTTLPFRNSCEPSDNRTEQQKIESNDSITNHVDPLSHLNACNNSYVRNNFKKIKVKKISWQISRTKGNDISGVRKSDSLRRPTSEPGIGHSDGSGNGADFIWEDDPSMTRPPRATGGDLNGFAGAAGEESEVVAVSDCRADDGSASEVTDQTVTLDQIDKEIKEIEKIIQSKCELLPDDNREKGIDKRGMNNSGTPPPKLRKISEKEGDMQGPQKDGDFVHPMPNLTKMVPEDRNWNLEYSEDDVKNLGLDDLLLRASELNAENFTKALGHNSSVSRNGSKGDAGSDIVLTFPKSRKNSDDGSGRDSENLKSINLKKAKLDFLKRYVNDDKPSAVPDEEPAKKVPDASPKRPGIKVKTVQNINEEFKDSLGAKLKDLEGGDVPCDAAVNNKSLYTIAEEPKNSLGGKDKFVPNVRDQVTNNPASLLACRVGKLNKADRGKSPVEDAEDSRPFIMTIIQNKDGTMNEHAPTILRSPKIFPRLKPIGADGINIISQMEERRGESVTNKKDSTDAADVVTPGDNVTLLVSEPRTSRPFEVVNVEDFVPDGGSGRSKRNVPLNSHYVVHYRDGSFTKKELSEKERNAEGKMPRSAAVEGGPPVTCKRKNIPFILNNPKKYLRIAPAVGDKATTREDKRIVCTARPVNRIVKFPAERDPNPAAAGTDQKAPPKETGGKFLKLFPSESNSSKASGKGDGSPNPEEPGSAHCEEADGESSSNPKQQVMSLVAFSAILKDILPDRWILSLDKRYGLQIIKTHLDELLNPSIMISVVVGGTGKVTVNVRGRQLEKSHDLFSNLCDVGNSNEKISINYILAILNKLRFFNVCFGCDDLSLKKYWCEDGFIEYYTEFQQTYRSHICESLVRLGKKRCYPCYRMHESLKKRKRRELLMKKSDAEAGGKAPAEADPSPASAPPANHQSKGVRRNLEEFLEESFITMKQKIADEIEKTREDEESEKVPKTQDEVLSFMGLTRKDSLDVNLRKSKRERKGFKKCESMIGNNVNKEELYFLEKYWPDINVLFSTSLLIGAYSRTSMGRLREKCKVFHKLLTTWRGIIRDNPDWLGGNISLAENLVDDEDPLNTEVGVRKFERMDVPALRAYIINCVKEVNKIKSRLRTKNTYFKVLYNTFVKPRMKKARQAPESSDGKEGEATPGKDPVKEGGEEEEEDADADAPDKAEDGTKPTNSANTTSTEVDSSDEKDEDTQFSNGVLTPGASDGE